MRQPTLANMAPGGKTPMVPRAELQDMGFRLVSYHPLLFTAVRTMQDALAALLADDKSKAPPAVSFDAHQEDRRASRIPKARAAICLERLNRAAARLWPQHHGET